MSLEQVQQVICQITTRFDKRGMAFLPPLKGDRTALVDSSAAASPGGLIQPAVAEVDLSPRELDLILNTHAYLDHVGGATGKSSLSPAPEFISTRRGLPIA